MFASHRQESVWSLRACVLEGARVRVHVGVRVCLLPSARDRDIVTQ